MLANVAFGVSLLSTFTFGLPTALVTPDLSATPSVLNPAPVVTLDYATYAGTNASGIVNFLGMRFAQPVN